MTTYTDSDAGTTFNRFNSYQLTVSSDISAENTMTQAIWNVIFGDTAQSQATAALAAAVALAAATTSTSTVSVSTGTVG
jgi:hypothetical protein